MQSSYIYCVFDQVANSYSPVFESRNDRTALRDIKQSFKGSLDTFCAENQLLCIAKLEKTNNDDFSELVIKHVEDQFRVIDWPENFDEVEVKKDE